MTPGMALRVPTASQDRAPRANDLRAALRARCTVGQPLGLALSGQPLADCAPHFVMQHPPADSPSPRRCANRIHRPTQKPRCYLPSRDLRDSRHFYRKRPPDFPASRYVGFSRHVVLSLTFRTSGSAARPPPSCHRIDSAPVHKMPEGARVEAVAGVADAPEMCHNMPALRRGAAHTSHTGTA
jgi:hypothetical protein